MIEHTIRELLSESDGLLVLGITGRQATIETRWMLDSGTRIAAGVTPGKGGQEVHGVPVFNSVREAVEGRNIKVAMNYAPAAAAPDAGVEAFEAGLKLVVVSAENTPVHPTMRAIAVAKRNGALMIGPNSQGIVVPGVGRVGCPGGSDPDERFRAGHVAVISRSGGMTSETAMLVRTWGYGTSLHLALGGSPTVGTTLLEGMRLADADPSTKAIVIFGEPSGQQEFEVARAVAEGGISKPVCALIGGRAADALPAELSFGHAPRADSGGDTAVADKIAALAAAGIQVAMNTRDVRAALQLWESEGHIAVAHSEEPVHA